MHHTWPYDTSFFGWHCFLTLVLALSFLPVLVYHQFLFPWSFLSHALVQGGGLGGEASVGKDWSFSSLSFPWALCSFLPPHSPWLALLWLVSSYFRPPFPSWSSLVLSCLVSSFFLSPLFLDNCGLPVKKACACLLPWLNAVVLLCRHLSPAVACQWRAEDIPSVKLVHPIFRDRGSWFSVLSPCSCYEFYSHIIGAKDDNCSFAFTWYSVHTCLPSPQCQFMQWQYCCSCDFFHGCRAGARPSRGSSGTGYSLATLWPPIGHPLQGFIPGQGLQPWYLIPQPQ